MAEIMPTRLRSKAYSLFVSINWVCAFLAGILTLSAINGLGGVSGGEDDDAKTKSQKTGCGVLFFIYCWIAVACLMYMHFRVPETKGRTPEQLFNKHGGGGSGIGKDGYGGGEKGGGGDSNSSDSQQKQPKAKYVKFGAKDSLNTPLIADTHHSAEL